MELAQVKSILHQTEIGELLMDGMGCSEPILSMKAGRLIDNFFVYFANKQKCTVSGPVAKIGIQADAAEIDYLISCEEHTFSLAPNATMIIDYPSICAEDYTHYGYLYTKVRDIAYKSVCTESEKQTIEEYMVVLKKIIAPAMMKFYQEMVPSFFMWVHSQIN